MLHVFKNSAFHIIPLTDALNNLKFVPSRLAQMGLFSASGISATSAAIEQRNGILKLIPPTQRGAPGTTMGDGDRSMLDIRVPHFEVNDAIMAEAVQGVRAFGSENELMPFMQLVADRGQMVSQSFDLTEEHARMGAIKGLITYADNSTLDLYSVFNVSQESEVDFDLDNANPADGALRLVCSNIIRKLQGILDGINFTGVHCFCGDTFFDQLLAHPEVRETYKGWSDAKILRESYIGPNRPSWGIFEFGGIVFENYRGSYSGTPFIHTDKAQLFPLGVPGLFRTYWAPADYIETVNTIGKRLYGKMYEMPNGKGMHFDMQTNALSICTRPRVLIPAKRT